MPELTGGRRRVPKSAIAMAYHAIGAILLGQPDDARRDLAALDPDAVDRIGDAAAELATLCAEAGHTTEPAHAPAVANADGPAGTGERDPTGETVLGDLSGPDPSEFDQTVGAALTDPVTRRAFRQASYHRGRRVMLADVLNALRERAETIEGYDDAYRHAADYLDVRFGAKDGRDG